LVLADEFCVILILYGSTGPRELKLHRHNRTTNNSGDTKNCPKRRKGEKKSTDLRLKTPLPSPHTTEKKKEEKRSKIENRQVVEICMISAAEIKNC